MEHKCDYCDEARPVEWTYNTVARGWKFLCEPCYDSLPGIQVWAEIYNPLRYYPTFDYDTRTIS